MDIFNKTNYHIIGIGGIGISAIARMLQLQGKKVSGSDAAQSEITDDLQQLGINISIGQRSENIPDNTEVVIYTVAIPESNPEMLGARKREVEGKLICVTYPQALGELSKNMFTIAVSGTHGKTTTTAMIGHILHKAGLDPTIIVGSKMLSSSEKSGGNFTPGKSKYLVVEACEYKRSFLNLHPQILVITNIEADHLDYYKDLADIQSAFDQLITQVSKDGAVITEKEYGGIEIQGSLNLPGEHNILNAKAAIKVALELGMPQADAEKYLEDFRGTWRRLEYKGEKDGNIFYDDYAHHPTEIAATLSALRSTYPDKKLVCVFEPHQQSRTKLLFGDFVESLSLADQVFIAPIYMARESKDDSISNKILADAINKKVPSFAVQNTEELEKILGSDHNLCVVMMGAGDIYKWTPSLLR